MATTKTTITTRVMRPSVRLTTASSQSETTRATSTSPSTTPMTMLTSTIAWCTPCVERARRAHSFTPGDVISHLIWLKSWANTLSSTVISMGAPFWLASPFLLPPFFPLFLRQLPPLRAVPGARQPDRHGKPVLLCQQGEWGRLRRLHLSHRMGVPHWPHVAFLST